MLATDRDALICDLAETYHVLDYKALPVPLLATLAAGLRDSSRIKLKMSGVRVQMDTFLLAFAADKLAWLVWSKTKDAEHGRNKPKSLVSLLLGEQQQSKLLVFDSKEAFFAARERMLQEVMGHGD